MIGEAIVGGTTLVILGAIWLANRVMTMTQEPNQNGTRMKTLQAQRAHWANVLESSYWAEDRHIATEELKRIDREMLK